jgi:hypothetical protein
VRIGAKDNSLHGKKISAKIPYLSDLLRGVYHQGRSHFDLGAPFANKDRYIARDPPRGARSIKGEIS